MAAILPQTLFGLPPQMAAILLLLLPHNSFLLLQWLQLREKPLLKIAAMDGRLLQFVTLNPL
jgi:hypothetical protein